MIQFSFCNLIMSYQEKKEYLKTFLQKIEIVLLKQELSNKSSKKLEYDGGIAGIVNYYTKKYKLVVPNSSKGVIGTTFDDIIFNTYNGIKSNSKIDYDIFGTDSLKMYYLKRQYAPFQKLFDNFYNSYENSDSPYPMWIQNINKMLLIFIAFKSNYKLGFNKKKDYELVKKKFDIFLKDYAQNYLINPKLNEKDLVTIWAFNIYDSQSQEAIKLAKTITLKLLQTPTTKKTKNGEIWWDIKKKDQNYLLCWISYGIMRDYLNSNSKKFIGEHSLTEMKLQTEDLEEGFKSRLEIASEKKKLLSKKTKDYPFWKILLAWILFPILIYISIRIFLYMTSKLFSFKMINEYGK